jgi:hypothetical protein
MTLIKDYPLESTPEVTDWLLGTDVDNAMKTRNFRISDVLAAGYTGYDARYSLNTHTHAFSELSSKPTTLAGFGISDAYTQTQINTSLGLKANLAGGNTLGGAQVLTSDAIGTKPLIVKGFSGQTANLQEWQDSTGAIKTNVTAAGVVQSPAGGFSTGGYMIAGASALNYGGTHLKLASGGKIGWASGGSIDIADDTTIVRGASGGVLVGATAAGIAPLTIKGAAGQTADLTQWQDSTGAIKSRFSSNGNLYFENGSTTMIHLLRPTGGADNTIGLGASNQMQYNAAGGAAHEFIGGMGTLFAIAGNGAISGYGASSQEMFNIYGAIRGGMAPPTMTTLSVALDTVMTTLTVVSTTAYPNVGTVLIDNEWIAYNGKTATTFTNCLRAQFGTTAATHAIGASCLNYLAVFRPLENLTNNVVITGQGRLGIGIYNPSSALHVSGSAGWFSSGVNIAGANHYYLEPSGNDVRIRNNSNGYISFAIPTGGGVQAFAPVAGAVGLTVKGAASQSANLQEWQDSGGTPKSWMDKDGGLVLSSNVGHLAGQYNIMTRGTLSIGNVSTTPGSASTLDIVHQPTVAGGATIVGIRQLHNASPSGANSTIRGVELNARDTVSNAFAVGMVQGLVSTAGLQSGSAVTDVRNLTISNSTAAGSVTDSRGVYITAAYGGAISAHYGIRVDNPTGAGTITTQYGLYLENQAKGATAYSIFSAGGKIQFESGAAGVTPLVVKGATSQSANLQEWQNSGGTPLVNILADGTINTDITTASTASYGMYLRNRNGSGISLRNSQGSWFQFLRESDGAGLGSIQNASAAGTANHLGVYGPSGVALGTAGTAGLIARGAEILALMPFTRENAASVPITVKGFASQSANLQEWQDSTGAVLASVTKDGWLKLPSASSIQSSDANVPFNLGLRPSGTATSSAVTAYNNATAGSAQYAQFGVQAGGNAYLNTGANTGSFGGILFMTNFVEKARITTAGDMEFAANAQGVVLRDRTTATKYRLYVNNGVLSIETTP